MKKPFTQDLRIIIFGAIAGFIGWMILQIAVWYALRSLGADASLWEVINALSQALTGATIAVGGFVAYRELSEAEASRHMEIADRLFDELNSEENIEARRWVFQELPDDPDQASNISAEGQQAIKRVLNSLDRVSFLTQEGWIPDDLIMPWMHPMIFKAWKKLAPYVARERTRRDEPYYYAYAEKVARRCVAWRAKSGIADKTTWLNNAL